MVYIYGYSSDMGEKAPREVLAENLKALMFKKYGGDNQTQLHNDSGIAQSTIGRWLRKESAATVDNLAVLGKVLGVQPYELLTPNLDPELKAATEALEKAAISFASTKTKP